MVTASSNKIQQMFSFFLLKTRHWIPLAMVAFGVSSCTHIEDGPPPTGSDLDSQPRFNQTQATASTPPSSPGETSGQTPATPRTPTAPADPRDELKNINPDAAPSGDAPIDPTTLADTTTQDDSNGPGQPDASEPTATDPEQLPFGIPVPGRPGTVYSPYDRTAGFVDVSGMAPGTVVTDPYTGNKFRVP